MADDRMELARRLDYIRAHRDCGGKFSDSNGNELLEMAEKLLEMVMSEKQAITLAQLSKILADRFLGWPLPASVCSDLCVTTREGQHQHLRRGTNLLDANETQQMIEYLLEDATLASILQPPPSDLLTAQATPSDGLVERFTDETLEKMFPNHVKRQKDFYPYLVNRFRDFAKALSATRAPEGQIGGADWKCKARHTSLPEPADCNWPHCGCDPQATRVMSALHEGGYSLVHDSAPEAASPLPVPEEVMDIAKVFANGKGGLPTVRKMARFIVSLGKEGAK